MKTLFVTCLALILIASPCEAGLAGFFTQKQRDWNFIQSVGGMKAHLSKKQLVVLCNVSGLKTITTKPKAMHSGIGVRKLKHSQVGDTIRLSVVTSVIEKGMKSECGSIDLSALPSGPYTLVYLNRDRSTHPIGTIDLP